jgi:4-hydroxybenzoate polyprenyltransferase
VLNDILDLPSDRRHPTKRLRPFAAGDLSIGAGLWLYLSRTSGITTIGRYGPVVFVLLMLAVQLASLVGPLPPSPAAVAASALGAYLVFAAVAGWIDRQRVPVARV